MDLNDLQSGPDDNHTDFLIFKKIMESYTLSCRIKRHIRTACSTVQYIPVYRNISLKMYCKIDSQFYPNLSGCFHCLSSNRSVKNTVWFNYLTKRGLCTVRSMEAV